MIMLWMVQLGNKKNKAGITAKTNHFKPPGKRGHTRHTWEEPEWEIKSQKPLCPGSAFNRAALCNVFKRSIIVHSRFITVLWCMKHRAFHKSTSSKRVCSVPEESASLAQWILDKDNLLRLLVQMERLPGGGGTRTRSVSATVRAQYFVFKRPS